MFFTPSKESSFTELKTLPTSKTRLSRKFTTESSHNKSSFYEEGSNKSLEKTTPITKLTIQISKRRISPSSPLKQSSTARISPTKFRVNIQSKMSTHSHEALRAYGVSTHKGLKNLSNPHHIGIHLGFVKNIMMVDCYDGSKAGAVAKKEYPLALMRHITKQVVQKPQIFMKQAFRQTQAQIISQQEPLGDNSGCSLASVIIGKDLITVGNVGSSQVICMTKNGSLLTLSRPHTTKNKKQIERVIRNGGRVYQSVINVPGEKELTIEGPIRVAPFGLVYTRALGRTLDYRRAHTDEDINPEHSSSAQTLTWMPEIQYIKTEQVVWIGMFSEAVITHCPPEEIKTIINSERSLQSTSYTEHHVAMECSRRITSRVLNQGVSDALSSIVMLLHSSIPESLPFKTNTNFSQVQKKKQEAKQIKNRTLIGKQMSFKYLGNRKSFVKEHRSLKKSHLQEQ